MMYWTIFIILMIAWLGCLVFGWTMGGWCHLLLVAAVVNCLVYALRDRRMIY